MYIYTYIYILYVTILYACIMCVCNSYFSEGYVYHQPEKDVKPTKQRGLPR